MGLLTFLFFQLRLQFKSLKFIEPPQVQGSIDDLVGKLPEAGEMSLREALDEIRAFEARAMSRAVI